MTPRQFARKTLELAATAQATEHLGEALMTQCVKRHVQETYGDASKLQDLAESTQAERVRLGYSPNDPGLRTGELLRDSIKVEFDALGFRVGSEEPVAAYFEFGTVKQPPRPAVAIGSAAALPEVEAIIGATVQAINGNRRPLELLAFAEVSLDEVL